MIDSIQAANGTMTMDDLKNYAVKVKQPLSITYRGLNLFAPKAPSSGAVTFSILKTMEQFPVEDLIDANLTSHRWVEAMKFAYGARQELGDPDFLGNLTEYQQLVISDARAKSVRSLILDNQTQPISVYDPQSLYAAESEGTSHIVVADCSGMTISSTTTINLLFGSQIMTPETGIILWAAPSFSHFITVAHRYHPH
jgi:gamma-glutamyltranspeptidase / glutathione hydrolase